MTDQEIADAITQVLYHDSESYVSDYVLMQTIGIGAKDFDRVIVKLCFAGGATQVRQYDGIAHQMRYYYRAVSPLQRLAAID